MIRWYHHRRGELTHSYSVESNNEFKITQQEIIELIQLADFEAVEKNPMAA